MTLKYHEVSGGIVTGGFTDWHAHTALIDPEGLRGGAFTRVWDLGSNLDDVVDLAARHAVDDDLPEIRFAGPFLTAPGGYPSDRSWAPEGSVHPLASPTLALHAVRFLVSEGAGCIKVTLHADAGPTPSDDIVRAVAREAALHRVPVVVHAEGAGQAARARRLGVTALAHTPFTEVLSDEEITRQAEKLSWVSTLAIHADRPEFDVAIDNMRRFHAAGGRVLYGTDMGNGPTPTGINPIEIDALRRADLNSGAVLAALTPGRLSNTRLFIPGTLTDLDFARAERIPHDSVA